MIMVDENKIKVEEFFFVYLVLSWRHLFRDISELHYILYMLFSYILLSISKSTGFRPMGQAGMSDRRVWEGDRYYYYY